MRSYAPRHRSQFFRWESGGLFSALVAALVVILAVGGIGVASAGKATAATTPLGTVTKSGTNLTTGSKATAGGPAGTAKPGDTLQWVLNYSNTQSSPASVNLTDPITGNQNFVPGSLQVPPGMGDVVHQRRHVVHHAGAGDGSQRCRRDRHGLPGRHRGDEPARRSDLELHDGHDRWRRVASADLQRQRLPEPSPLLPGRKR